MESRLKRIYNYFEGIKKGSQIEKLKEESGELTEAIEKYTEDPTQLNFEEILKEYSDVTVVLKQLILKRGMTLECFDSITAHFQEVALSRTDGLRLLAIKRGVSYDEVRDELRNM